MFISFNRETEQDTNDLSKASFLSVSGKAGYYDYGGYR